MMKRCIDGIHFLSPPIASLLSDVVIILQIVVVLSVSPYLLPWKRFPSCFPPRAISVIYPFVRKGLADGRRPFFANCFVFVRRIFFVCDILLLPVPSLLALFVF